MVFPEATERVLEGDGGKLTAINLKVFQYVKLIDNASGVIRVVRGEATVFLGPTESIIGKGKVDAVAIDTDTAVPPPADAVPPAADVAALMAARFRALDGNGDGCLRLGELPSQGAPASMGT